MSILLLLAQSGSGGLNTPQYFGDEAEHWDEDLDFTFVGGSYQQADVQPQIEDAWDHFVTDDDDQVLDESYQGSQDSAPVFTDGWDHFQAEDDEQAPLDDSQQSVVTVVPPQYYGDEAEQLVDDAEVVYFGGSYQQADIQPQIEDPWDWFVTDDDDWLLPDDYALASVAIATSQYYGEDAELLDQEDDDQVILPNDPTDSVATYYGEDAELIDQDDDEQVNVDAYALVDNNPVITLEDAWDWFPAEDDEQPLSDDYLGIGDTLPQYYGETAEQLDQDDDEQVWLDDVQLINVVSTVTQYYGEDAELLDQDDDEQWCVDESNVQNATLAQSFDDPWDYWPTDDDEQSPTDDYLNANPITAEDAWDHFATDDDEWFSSDDYANDVSICVEDPWDHFATDDDEQWPVDEAQQPLIAGAIFDEAWDWTDDADEFWPLDETLGASIAVVPVIAAEDSFDWFSQEADDYYVDDDYGLINFSPPVVILTLNGVGFSFCVAWGMVLQLRMYRSPDPRRWNASNAWLGYRNGGGGPGIH